MFLYFLAFVFFLLCLLSLKLLTYNSWTEAINALKSTFPFNKITKNKSSTMNNLPNHIKLDIFKCLDFDQLIKIQNVSRYLNQFIEDYRKELALDNISEISVVHKLVLKYKSQHSYYTEINSADLDVDIFTLSNELEKKWEIAIAGQIPLYLSYNEPCKAKIRFYKNKFVSLKLPYFPKNIKDMFIIHFWLKKLLNCTFNKAEFDNIIFNPALIKLLFENGNKLLFHTNNTLLRYSITNFENQAMKFIKDHLVICKEFTVDFTLCNDFEQCNGTILNILKEGNKFPYVKIIFSVGPSLFELIKNYLQTSTNCSNFVSKVDFEVTRWDNFWNFDYLRNMADETNECIYNGNHLYNSKYKIINENDPKMTFLASYMWRDNAHYDINFTIKRK